MRLPWREVVTCCPWRVARLAGGRGARPACASLEQYTDPTRGVTPPPGPPAQLWRVYQRGMERWLADLLQPVFDNLVADKMVPRFVQRLRILEFTIDHEAPYFSNMRRRTSRKARRPGPRACCCMP